MRRDEWDRCYISLVTEGKPKKLSVGHDTIIWEVLNKPDSRRLTLDQVVELCERRGYRTESSRGLRESVKWRLHYLIQRNNVRIELDAKPGTK